MKGALLFDLDDTLVVEKPAAQAAFVATARAAAERHPVDVESLVASARSHARRMWHATPAHPYCKRIGISSWEGLWCRFEGDHDEAAWLRAWAPEYRREAWRRALAEQGIDDADHAADLGERFGVERRARHSTHTDARAALAQLEGDYALAVVTNGASCLQREKLAASGLADYFGAVVVAGDVGAAKPDPAVFERALTLLGHAPENAVMIGDTLERDIAGARALGMRTVWLARDGRGDATVPDGTEVIGSLADLPGLLDAVSARS